MPETEPPMEAAPPESRLPLRIRQLLPAVVVFLFTVRALGPVKDPDTFWHLATGDWLRETWSFSSVDPWSNSSTNEWVLHEWLPQLALSWMQEGFGLPGVAWLHTLVTAGLALVLWATLRRRASLLLSAVLLAVTLLAMSASLSPRPHLITFGFTLVAVDAWLRTSQDGKPRWWLIPLTWLWAISHGMWFMSVLIGATVLAGIALDRTAARRALGRLSLLLAGSFLVAALTPAGPSLLASPFQVSAYTKFVTEWESPSLNDAFFIAFLVLVVPVVLVWARRRQQVPWTRLLLTGLAVGLALKYSRTVAVGAAIMAPITAEALHAATGLAREAVLRTEKVVVGAVATLALAVTAILAPTKASEPGLGPAGLNASLDALPDGTVVCNEYLIGGWLIWRHPNIRPAIDGRTEIYPVDYVEQYIDFTRSAPGWQRLPARAGCSYVLLPEKMPVVEALEAQLHWEEADAADGYVLLRSPE